MRTVRVWDDLLSWYERFFRCCLFSGFPMFDWDIYVLYGSILGVSVYGVQVLILFRDRNADE